MQAPSRIEEEKGAKWSEFGYPLTSRNRPGKLQPSLVNSPNDGQPVISILKSPCIVISFAIIPRPGGGSVVAPVLHVFRFMTSVSFPQFLTIALLLFIENEYAFIEVFKLCFEFLNLFLFSSERCHENLING